MSADEQEIRKQIQEAIHSLGEVWDGLTEDVVSARKLMDKRGVFEPGELEEARKLARSLATLEDEYTEFMHRMTSSGRGSPDRSSRSRGTPRLVLTVESLRQSIGHELDEKIRCRSRELTRLIEEFLEVKTCEHCVPTFVAFLRQSEAEQLASLVGSVYSSQSAPEYMSLALLQQLCIRNAESPDTVHSHPSLLEHTLDQRARLTQEGRRQR